MLIPEHVDVYERIEKQKTHAANNLLTRINVSNTDRTVWRMKIKMNSKIKKKSSNNINNRNKQQTYLYKIERFERSMQTQSIHINMKSQFNHMTLLKPVISCALTVKIMRRAYVMRCTVAFSYCGSYHLYCACVLRRMIFSMQSTPK